jgi:hypothetical protein
MANKKRQQTINKRNRERAVEEKRTLKRQAKQEKREAARNGEPLGPLESPFEHDLEPGLGEPGLAEPAEPGAESVD